MDRDHDAGSALLPIRNAIIRGSNLQGTEADLESNGAILDPVPTPGTFAH